MPLGPGEKVRLCKLWAEAYRQHKNVSKEQWTGIRDQFNENRAPEQQKGKKELQTEMGNFKRTYNEMKLRGDYHDGSRFPKDVYDVLDSVLGQDVAIRGLPSGVQSAVKKKARHSAGQQQQERAKRLKRTRVAAAAAGVLPDSAAERTDQELGSSGDEEEDLEELLLEPNLPVRPPKGRRTALDPELLDAVAVASKQIEMGSCGTRKLMRGLSGVAQSLEAVAQVLVTEQRLKQSEQRVRVSRKRGRALEALCEKAAGNDAPAAEPRRRRQVILDDSGTK